MIKGFDVTRMIMKLFEKFYR